MSDKNLKNQLINLNIDLKCKDPNRIKEIEKEKLKLKSKIERKEKECVRKKKLKKMLLEEEEYLFQEGYEKVLNAISNEDYIEIKGMENTFFDKYNCGLWFHYELSDLIGLKNMEDTKIYEISTDVYSSIKKDGDDISDHILTKKDHIKNIFNKIGLYKDSSNYYMELKINNNNNNVMSHEISQ